MGVGFVVGVVGVVILSHAAYSTIQYRGLLKNAKEEFSRPPMNVVVELLLGLVLCMWAALTTPDKLPSIKPDTDENRVSMADSGLPVATTGSASVSASAPTIRQVKLDRESELRIEVADEKPLRLRLLDGNAEVFGVDLPPDIWFTFPPHLKFAVFTWHGATIELDGTTETDYTAAKTPMVNYVNVHAILEGQRDHAKASIAKKSVTAQGPRVIVIGPTDSGKSTLSRMLLSWAVRQGWKPTFVDLDVGQGAITVPGCIAATPIEMAIDPVEGFPREMPLVYFFGHTTASNNVELYRVLVKEFAQTLEKRFAGNAEFRAAGMVINTMGWIQGLGYELILHAIDSFRANVVLVLGEGKLFSKLRDGLKNRPNVEVVKLQKSSGVESRNTKVRQKARSYRIREYFYGLSNDLSPHSCVANFNDLHVYRIGGGPEAPGSALPIGADPFANPLGLVPVTSDRMQELIHLVLALSYAEEPDQIISSNVAGFIYVTEIDIGRKQIKYLSPSTGDLLGKYLIAGTLSWIDK